MSEGLLEKYRPRLLDDILGQPDVIARMRDYLRAPHSAAFLFSGPTGCGKSSCAIALAQELGVDVRMGSYGGFFRVSSGEQLSDTIREHVRELHYPPLGSKSGWRLMLVDEFDLQHPSSNVGATWLSVLDELPPHSVIIATTNNPSKLPARLSDRFQHVQFCGNLMQAAEDLIDRIWKSEGLSGPRPGLRELGLSTFSSPSLRKVLQSLAPVVASLKRPFAPAPTRPRETVRASA